MNIAFVSGVKFGLDLLSDILDKGWKVSVIFSYDDNKRKLYSDYESFDDIAKKHDIKHFKVNNINDDENILQLQKICPDIILVMGWSQILKKDILSIPHLGVIGSHPTILPKYRGRAPIPWTILKGLKESGLTFFYMKEGVDDGDILSQRRFEITNDDDATNVYRKITELGKIMLSENLSLLQNNTAKRIKQDESQFVEYWNKRTPEDGKIDWSKPAEEIQKLVRASTHPYPGAFSFFDKSKIKIWKAKYLDDDVSDMGKIIEINKEGVRIATGKGSIILQMISIEDNEDTMATNIFTKDDVGKSLG